MTIDPQMLRLTMKFTTSLANNTSSMNWKRLTIRIFTVKCRQNETIFDMFMYFFHIYLTKDILNYNYS